MVETKSKRDLCDDPRLWRFFGEGQFGGTREETVDTEWTVKERDLDDPDFELPLDEKGHLDVDEWLSQEFMFQIPTVLLCSPDCAGLCPQCGKKKAECTCQPAEPTEAPVDTRLAILKSLLN